MKSNFKRALSVGLLKVKKASPAIMIVAGAVGSVGAMFWACKQTRKLDDTIAPIKEEIDDIHKMHEDNPDGKEYSEKEYKKDLTKAYTKMATETVKLYVGPAIVEVASIASIVGSHRIMARRYAALGAAYTSLDTAFKSYRQNVTERYGEGANQDAKFGIHKEVIKETDEKGNEKDSEVDMIDQASLDNYSIYAKFFDESCPAWEKEPEYNLAFIKGVQDSLNHQLMVRGYVFLNEAYKRLGMPETQVGTQVGWIYDLSDPKSDNFIDFGIYDTSKPRTKEFVNGYENVLLIDFNVNGNITHILNKI